MSAASRASRWGLTVALASLMLPGTAGAQTGGTTAESAVSRAPDENAVGSLDARFDDSLRGGGVVAQGASFAGREDGVVNTSADITVAGIPAGAAVQRALLYWMISGGTDTTALINTVAVTGVQVAVAGDTCWGQPTTPTFRADVTTHVTGNGLYTIADLPSSADPAAADTNGVALVVVYQDASSGTVRRVMIRDGAISTNTGGDVVTDTFTGVAAPFASAGRFHLVVGDGQAFLDGNLSFNGVILGASQFAGNDGSLWDVNSYDVTVPAGLADATWNNETDQDCLEFETAVLDFDVAVCGDGLIHSPEQCDQGNTTNGDGCSAQCNVEPGWQCSGQPSMCAPIVAAAPEALAVDTAGNLVYQPNETVVVAPTWRNMGVTAIPLVGTLANHTGPAGPTYSIPDDAASYGTIAVGGTASCGSNCYSVANTATTRPGTHWDTTADETVSPTTATTTRTWTLHVGDSFTDVPSTNGFYRFIETILHKNVTGGCTATAYCPSADTTRDQMAVFVLVSKEPAGYVPAACGATPMFTDVPVSSGFCRWVEELARRGVVGGCGPNLYCPDAPATREQMAVFVLRTLDPALNPPACGTPMFNDVPASNGFCRWIEELARRGVVTGCGGGNYCPTAAVTREQMGVFLAVTFSISLYGL